MKGATNLRLALLGVTVLLAFFAVLLFSGWSFTTWRLALSRSGGIYSTAEQGMRSLIGRGYTGVTRIDILYAGPNSFDGLQPHVWYVIAEVHAAGRADGEDLGRNLFDAPGSFFLQTEQGWVHVSEGAFPEVVGLWMRGPGFAGPGQSTSSTDWAPGQPARYCQSA